MKKIPFKKIIIGTIAAIAAIVLFVIIINVYIIQSTKGRIYDSADAAPTDKTYDCILILGAGLRPDGSPSAMLAERLDCGLELYRKGISPKIIVSGDHGTEDYDEVNTMKSYLVAKGVPDSDIFMDHAGFSTYDSIYRAQSIFRCSKICIVTQKYHLYRALFIADKRSIEACGVDAAILNYRGQHLREVRECAARLKDFFTSSFGILPKYLGEEIPVWGNGNVTNDK